MVQREHRQHLWTLEDDTNGGIQLVSVVAVVDDETGLDGYYQVRKKIVLSGLLCC